MFKASNKQKTLEIIVFTVMNGMTRMPGLMNFLSVDHPSHRVDNSRKSSVFSIDSWVVPAMLVASSAFLGSSKLGKGIQGGLSANITFVTSLVLPHLPLMSIRLHKLIQPLRSLRTYSRTHKLVPLTPTTPTKNSP